MKIAAAFPSKYLKAADLEDRPRQLVMHRVEMEDVGDTDRKPVLYFTKAKKGLILNRTNSKMIASAYGDDTDMWEDKEIVLFPAMVDFKGDTVEAIRVKIPKIVEKPRDFVVPVQHSEIDPPQHADDEIPF